MDRRIGLPSAESVGSTEIEMRTKLILFVACVCATSMSLKAREPVPDRSAPGKTGENMTQAAEARLLQLVKDHRAPLVVKDEYLKAVAAGNGSVTIVSSVFDRTWTLDITDQANQTANVVLTRDEGTYQWVVTSAMSNGVALSLPGREGDYVGISLGNFPVYPSRLARASLIAQIRGTAIPEGDYNEPEVAALVANLRPGMQVVQEEESNSSHPLDVLEPTSMVSETEGLTILIGAAGDVFFLANDASLRVRSVRFGNVDSELGVTADAQGTPMARIAAACGRLFDICMNSQNEATAVQACTAVVAYCPRTG